MIPRPALIEDPFLKIISFFPFISFLSVHSFTLFAYFCKGSDLTIDTAANVMNTGPLCMSLCMSDPDLAV